MTSRPFKKIISGGQTGVDRAALDVAIELEIPHGGWCPAGRRAEDGTIASIYQLQETSTRNYAQRTEKNVLDSCGTLILYQHQISGGTALTRRLSHTHTQPCLCLDLGPSIFDLAQLLQSLIDWGTNHQIDILNVAGPRASTQPEIYAMAYSFMKAALSSPTGRQ
ncbi:MAG: hypothetical protein GY880_15855 [Planctomycetaceae bacterium]|nr:hypothetical protein [Planctomycetaceae bacterium]